MKRAASIDEAQVCVDDVPFSLLGKLENQYFYSLRHLKGIHLIDRHFPDELLKLPHMGAKGAPGYISLIEGDERHYRFVASRHWMFKLQGPEVFYSKLFTVHVNGFQSKALFLKNLFKYEKWREDGPWLNLQWYHINLIWDALKRERIKES